MFWFCRFWILYRAKQDGPVVLVRFFFQHFNSRLLVVSNISSYVPSNLYRVGVILGRDMKTTLRGIAMDMRYFIATDDMRSCDASKLL